MTLALIGTVMTFASALMLRVYERTVPDAVLGNIENCLWLVSITQLTLGYGEIVPKSHLGRSLIIGACFFENLLISYFVISTVAFIGCNHPESKFVRFMTSRRETGLNLKIFSTVAIQRWWRYILKQRKNEKHLVEVHKFDISLSKFALRRRKITADKKESIGELVVEMLFQKNKALGHTELHTLKLKAMKETQQRIKQTQQTINSKINRYYLMLKSHKDFGQFSIIEPQGSILNRNAWSVQIPYKSPRLPNKTKPVISVFEHDLNHFESTELFCQPSSKQNSNYLTAKPTSFKRPAFIFTSSDQFNELSALDEKPFFPPSPSTSATIMRRRGYSFSSSKESLDRDNYHLRRLL